MNAAASSRHTWLVYGVHGGIPLLLWLFAVWGSLHRLHTFSVADLDYGLFEHVIWNIADGNGWRCSLYEGQVRVNFLADHFALIMPLFAPFLKIFPHPYTLAVIHACAFGLTFALVPVLVREIYGAAGRKNYLWAAVFLLCTLAAFKGFAGAWRFQTHMTTLVMPGILCALIGLHRNALGWVLLCCLVVGMAQERAVVAVFGIGMYAILITGQTRLGILLCLTASAYFIAILKFIIPSFYTDGEYIYTGSIDLFYGLKEKTLFVINVFVYMFFLPLAGKRALMSSLCAFSVIGIGLMSSREPMYSFVHQYQDMPSIFLIAAAAHGLVWVSGQAWFSRIPVWCISAVAVGCIAFSANFSKHNLPIKQVFGATVTPEMVQLRHDLQNYAAVPPQLAVYAPSKIGPWVALRKYWYTLTPERSGQPFTASLVLSTAVAASEAEQRDIEAILATNQSLVLVEDTGVLKVYKSVDLVPERKKQ